MQLLWKVPFAVAVAVTLAACSDLPSGPKQTPPPDLSAGGPSFDAADGCVSDGFCILPPIEVIGEPSECDPWKSLNWCQCEESAPGGGDVSGVDGCNGGGGGGEPGTGPGDPGSGPGGGGGEVPPAACPDWDPGCDNDPWAPESDPCQTGDPMVDAPNVYSEFQELWTLSVEQGVERGGWIVQEGSSYRLVQFQNATYTACGIDIHESPPAGTVAMVHTHPWPLWSVTPCGTLNTGTPSSEDIAALQALGLSTGYLLDGGGIGRYTAAGGEQSERLGRCGY
jgi:hypothetical protein